MKITRIGSRGYLASFDQPYMTNVYVIDGPEHLFVCDTFLGPKPIQDLLSALRRSHVDPKSVVVFNSHHHYDHVWGNMHFASSAIIAHVYCRDIMLQTGDRDLTEFSAHAQGKVVITPPNLVFTHRVSFPDEGVEFFHSPGHTSDSSSCYDSVDRFLFVGDNVESPIPYLNDDAFDTYISTLEFYMGLQWDSLITGHDPFITDKSLILSNLQYINDFKNLGIDSSALTTGELSRHYTNLTTVGRYLLAGGQKSEAEKYYKEAFHILESMGDSRSAKEQLDALRRELS